MHLTMGNTDETVNLQPAESGLSAIFARRIAPIDLLQCQRWVTWGAPGQEKKIPINPHSGGRAVIGNARTYGTASKAFMWARTWAPEGECRLGLMLGQINEDFYLAGIDFDACRNPETGVFEPWAQRAIDSLDAWTEISMSGLGCKAMFAVRIDDVPRVIRCFRETGGTATHWTSIKLPARESEKASGIEVALDRKFFALTGRKVRRSVDELVIVEPSRLERIIRDMRALRAALTAEERKGAVGTGTGTGAGMWVPTPGWEGPGDDTGSGRMFALAREVVGRGGTRQEFFDLALAADAAPKIRATLTKLDHKGAARQLERAWQRALDSRWPERAPLAAIAAEVRGDGADYPEFTRRALAPRADPRIHAALGLLGPESRGRRLMRAWKASFEARHAEEVRHD